MLLLLCQTCDINSIGLCNALAHNQVLLKEIITMWIWFEKETVVSLNSWITGPDINDYTAIHKID